MSINYFGKNTDDLYSEITMALADAPETDVSEQRNIELCAIPCASHPDGSFGLIYDPNTVLPPDSVTVGLAQKAATITDEVFPDEPIRVLDLGSGSGAFLFAVSASLPHAEIELLGVDVDPEAVYTGRYNAISYLQQVATSHTFAFDQCDWSDEGLWQDLVHKKIHLIFGNLPFLHEREALKPGFSDAPRHTVRSPDRFGYYENLLGYAVNSLVPGGTVLFRSASDARSVILGHGLQGLRREDIIEAAAHRDSLLGPLADRTYTYEHHGRYGDREGVYSAHTLLAEGQVTSPFKLLDSVL